MRNRLDFWGRSGDASSEQERIFVRSAWGVPATGGPTAGLTWRTFGAALRGAASRSEIAKHTAFVPTASFARPARQSPNVGHGHHWFGNAESYFLIGDAMGHAMLRLISQNTSSTSTKPPGKTPR